MFPRHKTGAWAESGSGQGHMCFLKQHGCSPGYHLNVSVCSSSSASHTACLTESCFSALQTLVPQPIPESGDKMDRHLAYGCTIQSAQLSVQFSKLEIFQHKIHHFKKKGCGGRRRTMYAERTIVYKSTVITMSNDLIHPLHQVVPNFCVPIYPTCQMTC